MLGEPMINGFKNIFESFDVRGNFLFRNFLSVSAVQTHQGSIPP